MHLVKRKPYQESFFMLQETEEQEKKGKKDWHVSYGIFNDRKNMKFLGEQEMSFLFSVFLCSRRQGV